ncbi:MAPEG family protein [Alkanindiges illinoisensis]|uniref:MAPEG family protein n=1 Tax=Alkanindiges illinoisensis TaxID=197183 RepID=UPI00047B635B|nr:MAPEG family protein [Alkanindiges illinoisensis]
MSSINSLIYVILAACLLPYVFAWIAKLSGGFTLKDNQQPREFMARTTGLAARANAVQLNSFESLPLFLTSVLLAEYLVVPTAITFNLSIAYLVLRLLYGCAYLANWATLRSILWLLSMACPVLLLLLTARI